MSDKVIEIPISDDELLQRLDRETLTILPADIDATIKNYQSQNDTASKLLLLNTRLNKIIDLQFQFAKQQQQTNLDLSQEVAYLDHIESYIKLSQELKASVSPTMSDLLYNQTPSHPEFPRSFNQLVQNYTKHEESLRQIITSIGEKQSLIKDEYVKVKKEVSDQKFNSFKNATSLTRTEQYLLTTKSKKLGFFETIWVSLLSLFKNISAIELKADYLQKNQRLDQIEAIEFEKTVKRVNDVRKSFSFGMGVDSNKRKELRKNHFDSSDSSESHTYSESSQSEVSPSFEDSSFDKSNKELLSIDTQSADSTSSESEELDDRFSYGRPRFNTAPASILNHEHQDVVVVNAAPINLEISASNQSDFEAAHQQSQHTSDPASEVAAQNTSVASTENQITFKRKKPNTRKRFNTEEPRHAKTQRDLEDIDFSHTRSLKGFLETTTPISSEDVIGGSTQLKILLGFKIQEYFKGKVQIEDLKAFYSAIKNVVEQEVSIDLVTKTKMTFKMHEQEQVNNLYYLGNIVTNEFFK